MGPMGISKARKESETEVPALGPWHRVMTPSPAPGLNLGVGTLRT